MSSHIKYEICQKISMGLKCATGNLYLSKAYGLFLSDCIREIGNAYRNFIYEINCSNTNLFLEAYVIACECDCM